MVNTPNNDSNLYTAKLYILAASLLTVFERLDGFLGIAYH